MSQKSKILVISLILVFLYSTFSFAAANDLYMKGIQTYYNENYKEAADILNKVLEKELDNSLKVDTLYFQTLCYTNLYEISKTKENINKLKNMGYEFGMLYWKLGEVYLNEKGKFDSAFYNEAVKQLEKAKNLGITSADFHRDLASCYQEMGKLSKAVIEYQNAILYKGGSAQDYLNLASLSKKLDNTEDAVKYYEQALSLQPDNISLYLELGRVYYNQTNYERAKTLFRQGVEKNPGFVPLRFELAQTYYANEDYLKAKNEFQKVIEKNKNYYRAYYYIGKIYFENKNYQEALNMFNECTRINPDYAKAYISMGNIYLEQENYYKAVSHFSTAIEKNKKNPDAHFHLALAYNKLDMKDAAIAELKQTLHLDSDYNQAQTMLNKLED